MCEEPDAKVTVLGKLTTVSSRPVGQGIIHSLSSLDHALRLHSIHVVFYYSHNPIGLFDMDPARMWLSEILGLYPVATGRLTKGVSGNWEVKCNDAGIRIVKARVDLTLDEWFSSRSDEIALATLEEMHEDPETWPPFCIQVNEFEGGGLAIGLSCRHIVADITSLVMLFKSWTGACSHGLVGHPPLFPRPLVHNHMFPYPINMSESLSQCPPVKMTTTTFKFPNSTIVQRLADVHQKLPQVTPFDFLAATFWRAVARLRPPDSNHKQCLSVCMDSSALREASNTLNYFGNCPEFSLLSMDQHEIDHSEPNHVVALVHHHMHNLGTCKISPSELEFRKLEGMMYSPFCKVYGHELTCINLENMVEGRELSLYGMCFADGERPIHVSCHVAKVGCKGLIIVLPSLGKFSRTVMLTLPEIEMDQLHRDQSIMGLEPHILFNSNNC